MVPLRGAVSSSPANFSSNRLAGAGTVVREDVPPGALAVSKGEQRNIEGWVERKRPDSKAADAARTEKTRRAAPQTFAGTP